MLVDTHCHINMMIKKTFDTLLSPDEITLATPIIQEAHDAGVTHIINVGTSVPESINSVQLASAYPHVFAAVGIHPNDCTQTWHKDFLEIKNLVKNFKKNKIVAIGEVGLDCHYPDYNLNRQQDAFRAHIELALEYNLALIVHTRDARDETLRVLEEYQHDISRGIIHCFSEDRSFAHDVIKMGFSIGIGGIITYPKNNYLREIVQEVSLSDIVLETDAPFLPPQHMRGKQNHPKYIRDIAAYIANLKQTDLETVATETSNNVSRIFELPLT